MEETPTATNLLHPTDLNEPNPKTENQTPLTTPQEPPAQSPSPLLPTSSPRHSISSNTSNAEPLSNYQKYGTIRPPISVLQDEFLEIYRSWKEHSDVLKGLESRTVGSSDGSMASVENLYNRFHREESGLMNSGLCGEFRHVFSEAEREENELGYALDGSSHDEEWQRMRHLADVLFSPGSKFTGATQLPTNSSRLGPASHSLINRDLKSYELYVMEGDGVDEIGKPKGVLCRHKMRGDEQCIFLKVNVVQLASVVGADSLSDSKDDGNIESTCEDETSNESKASVEDGADSLSETKDDDNLGNARKDETANDGTKDESNSEVPEATSSINEAAASEPLKLHQIHPVTATAPEHKYTIQIEYSDGETLCQGHWDHKTSRFNGTVQIVSAGRTESNPMGGTIISGLIGGRSGGGSIIETDGEQHIVGVHPRRRSSIQQTSQLHSFLLSPCTHNHPRGINPVPLHTLAELLDIETNTDTNSTSVNANTKDNDQACLIEEVLSRDNLKVILHRARAASLREETLQKLVELGGYIDFSEEARKRNVAQRREKWRNAMSRFKPKFPQRFRRRRSATSSHPNDDEPKVEKKKVQFYDHLANLSWTDLLEESGIQSEKVCATFRRRVALLNSLTFPTDEYKTETMSNLRSNGLSLINSHTEWDQCIQMGRTIALGWSWFERGSWGCFERSAVVGRRCVHILFQMHSRLESNHDRLEKAYRKADARLTTEQLDRITIANPNTDEGEHEHLCGICHCDVNELEEGNVDHTDRPMFLICSHGFHWGCIHEWLHENTSCPVCRLDFNVSL